jgi:hypothetical protein
MTVPAVSAGQVTLLLDASASMNAIDSNGSRFEQAKREALSIVDTLSANDRLTVIRVAEVPETLISRSQDRDEARNQIRSAAPSLTESDWEAALNLAAAGSGGAEDFSIVILSDGGLPEGAGLPGITGEVRYIPVGQSAENVALTALATRSRPGETPELYAQITNYGDSDARVVFTLFADGQRLDTSTVDVPANGTQSFFRPMPDPFITLQATLTQSVNSPAPDYLDVDNVAYAVGNLATSRRVLLVTDGNRFLEQVLLSLPGLEVVRTDGSSPLPPEFDLYVLDQIVPETIPSGDLLFLNPPESVPGLFTLGERIEDASNPFALPNDPRTQFLDVNPLFIVSFNALLNADWAEPIITTDGGPVLVAGEVAGRQVAVLPFDPVRDSNLALDIAWPILIANLTEWFAPSVAITVTDSLSVGDSLLIRLPFETETIRVTTPQDETVLLPVERESVVFAGTHEPGVYMLELLQGEEVVSSQPFAVNLFSPLESEIQPVAREDLTLQGVTLALEETEELGQREFWPVVALLALAVLLLEWYAYHRRMQVPSVFGGLRRRPA